MNIDKERTHTDEEKVNIDKERMLRDKEIQRLKSFGRYLFQLHKWVFFAIITGVVVGSFGILFAKSMNFVTELRNKYDFIVFFLPVIGIVIVAMYSFAVKGRKDRGTNAVISAVSSTEDLPFRVAPLIFIATVLTHLGGGSAGREGAALQLGGSIGNFIGKIFRIDENDRKVIIMCGMSAAFSALFGTPMAASIFAVEVISVGILHYSAWVPCVFSALVASRFASDMGIRAEHFNIIDVAELNVPNAFKIVVLALVCAIVSIAFCYVLHYTDRFLKKIISNAYIRVFAAGTAIVLAGLLFGTTDYFGAGVNVIERAIEGDVIWYAFIAKMLFTAVTLSAGYKGGEIVPSFFVGATLGCLLGHIMGISPSMCAAVGMIALFCGVTNCPMTSLLISFELFGYEVVPFFLMAVAVSYMMSGYTGLYKDQKIMYSKSKTKYINKKVSDIYESQSK